MAAITAQARAVERNSPDGPAPLTQRRLAAFGLIALPLSIAELPLAIYLTTFCVGDLGVSIAIMSWVILAVRLADFVTDPLIGMACDRSAHWPLGRRKSWMLIGVPMMMAGIALVFYAKPGINPFLLLAYIYLMYFGWTTIQIAYGAWAAELSGDYSERSRITGWRTLFGMVGVLAATVAPLATGGGPGSPQGLTPVMHGLGLWSLAVFPIGAILLAWLVPEPTIRGDAKPISWLEGIKIAMRNGPFMRILFATTIGRIGATANATVVIWFFFFVMGLGTGALLPVIIYLLAAVLGVPVWVIVGSKISKHRALVIAVLSSITAFAFLLLVPTGSVGLACFIMLLAGIGGSAALTLGQSIAADVIDLDELRAGRSRGGLLIAFWNMGGKLADALGGFVALQILGAFGFNPAAANDPHALMGLTVTYILVPWPFYLVSIVLLWNFPITPAIQARIRKLIERRAARRALPPVEAVDPIVDGTGPF